MEQERFERLVTRLEQESASAPRAYRTKVAGLALLGFGILALLLATVGIGVVAIVGLVTLAVYTGGGWALLLLAKFGKLALLLLIPLWYMGKSALRALLLRLPPPEGRELRREEAPALFAALDDMRRRLRGPRIHHVLLVDEVNAGAVQRPAWGLVGWPRNYVLLGLPLLESMPPQEALAVVAHEYGHLAGSHGAFSAYIYRLRTSWGTVQAFAEHVQGWLARLVLPLIRWYVPYFNAYTFVLARTDEYHADAAAADLVGRAHAAHALKRVNLIAPRHERFMGQTLERVRHEPVPPPDLMHRWAALTGTPALPDDARLWLDAALDRVGSAWDTHPTLRARLAALDLAGDDVVQPPPEPAGQSAAQAWFGARLDTLRNELQSRWARQVEAPWAERYAETCKERERLQALRAQPERNTDDEVQMLRLSLRHEPEQDWLPALEGFNAAHADHPLGLFLEAQLRLERKDRTGLALLDRVMTLDADAIKPACEHAHAFLIGAKEPAAAEAYAERWRARDAVERQA